jgi:hypothetical protein
LYYKKVLQKGTNLAAFSKTMDDGQTKMSQSVPPTVGPCQWDVDYSPLYKISTWNEDFGVYWDLYNVEQVTNAGGHVRFSGVDRTTTMIYVISLPITPPAPNLALVGDPSLRQP